MAAARMSSTVRTRTMSRPTGTSPDIQPRCPRLVEMRRLATPMIPRNTIHVVNPTATAAETAILRCARDGGAPDLFRGQPHAIASERRLAEPRGCRVGEGLAPFPGSRSAQAVSDQGPLP